MNHTTHFDDCGCLSARYEARIAALEAERGEWRAAAGREIAIAYAHANDLRGALERVRNTAWIGGNEGMRSMCQEALAATPAASLSALKAEVLERALGSVRSIGLTRGWHEDRAGFDHGQEWMRKKIEDAIRALAAQEVKPHA